MPAVKKSDVLEDSVKKAFDDLNSSVKLSVDLLVLMTKSAKDINASLGNGSNISQVAAANAKYNEQLKEQAAIEQKIIDSKKRLADLNAKATKAQNENTKATEASTKADEAKAKAAEKQEAADKKKTDQAAKNAEKEAKAAEKTAKASEKAAAQAAEQSRAYVKLNKAHVEATKKAKDLGAELGTESKEFKKAAAEANKLGDQLKEIDGDLGQHQRNVGNYKDVWEGAIGALSAMGLALGAGGLAIGFFNKTIEGSQAAGDAWERMMGGMEAASASFFSMVGKMDFSNFIDNIQRAVEAGREYADALDDLFEGGLGLDIAEAKAEKAKLIQETIRDDVRKTKDERLAAAYEINKIEEDLTQRRLIEAGKEFKAHADYVNGVVGLDDKKLIAFIENYREEEGLRNEVIKKTTEIADLEQKINTARSASAGGASAMMTATVKKDAKDRIKIITESMTDDEKVYASFLEKYSGATDDMIKNVIASYAAMTQVEAQQMAETKKNNKKIAAFEKELADEAAKAKGDQKAKTKDLIKIQEQLLQQAQSTEATTEQEIINRKIKVEAIEREIKRLKELGSVKEVDKIDIKPLNKDLDSGWDDLLKADEEYLDSYVDTQEKLTKKAEEEAQKRADIMLRYNDEIFSGVGQLTDVIFENMATSREDDLDNQIEYLQGRLDNDKLDDEQREGIQKEIDQKEKERKIKNAKAEKQEALMKLGVDTLMAVAKIKAQAAILASNPLTLAYVPAALAEIPFVLISSAFAAAAIAARKIPEYAKGTDYHSGGFAVVGDGGKSELVETPSGAKFLTPDTDTVMNLPRGSKVTAGEDVANRLTELTRRELINMAVAPQKDLTNERLLNQLIDEQRRTRRAIENNKPHQQDVTGKIRTELLREKMRN